VLFGGRTNSFKQDFERVLSTLKDAGADLIFISKWAESADVAMHENWRDPSQGLKLISKIVKIPSVEEVKRAPHL
jgi:hypothetical protein